MDDQRKDPVLVTGAHFISPAGSPTKKELKALLRKFKPQVTPNQEIIISKNLPVRLLAKIECHEFFEGYGLCAAPEPTYPRKSSVQKFRHEEKVDKAIRLVCEWLHSKEATTDWYDTKLAPDPRKSQRL